MTQSTLRTGYGANVLIPEDSGYDAERTGWNLAVQHHPAVVVVAESPEDVAAAVRHAVAEGLPIGVMATGHGPAAPADGAVLVVTHRLNGLQIDPARKTATIGAGVKWDRVIAAAAPHGLAPLVGSTPDVSAVGYLTGGGLPVLGRTFGFAADHVRSLEVVTADGVHRHVSEVEHPDLFWAIRGGKDNFGIVTSVEVELLPIDRIYGGNLIFSGERAGEVLERWRAWTIGVSEQMSTSIGLIRFPEVPDVPEPMRGRFVSQVRIAWTGDPDEGARLIEPLRALAPELDTVADMPHERIGEIHNDPVDPVPVRDGGTIMRDLDAEAVGRITDLVGPGTTRPPVFLEIRLLGGALARSPQRPHSVGPRDASFSLVVGSFTHPDIDEQVMRDQRALFDQLAPWDAGQAHPNFLSSGVTDADLVRRAYRAGDYLRLRQIKTEWDAGNLFRVNHNIPPVN